MKTCQNRFICYITDYCIKYILTSNFHLCKDI
ncbi:unnamed protein product, partial [Allacma fusca]